MQIQQPLAVPRVDQSLRVEVIHTAASLASFEEEYRALLDRSSRANVYQSWEWIHRWWSAFGGPLARLCVIVFRHQDQVVGCAPMVVRRPAGIPMRRLEPIGVLRSDYMDILIQDGWENRVLSAFEAHLRSSRGWDLLDLQQLPEDSPTLRYFMEHQVDLGCDIDKQETCPAAVLPDTWEKFLAGLGKKNRYNVGYYRRLIERDFTVWIGRVGPEDLDTSMEELFRLHQLRWRKRRLPGALFSPKVRNFHRGVAGDLLERQCLDLYRLDLNGRAVAMLYCFAQNGRGYYYLGGFDPEYSRYSVGTVLTAFAIQQSISRGHEVFDFLRGDEPYKYRWNVTDRFNYRVQWRRGGLRSHALYGLNRATGVLEHQAKLLARKMEKCG